VATPLFISETFSGSFVLLLSFAEKFGWLSFVAFGICGEGDSYIYFKKSIAIKYAFTIYIYGKCIIKHFLTSPKN
jgi:hypothetical protein